MNSYSFYVSNHPEAFSSSEAAVNSWKYREGIRGNVQQVRELLDSIPSNLSVQVYKDHRSGLGTLILEREVTLPQTASTLGWIRTSYVRKSKGMEEAIKFAEKINRTPHDALNGPTATAAPPCWVVITAYTDF